MRKNEAGFTLIEVLAAVTIMAILIPSVLALMNLGSGKARQRTAAEQLKQVHRAATEYIQANYATLQAAATASDSVSVSVADLKSGGYLPATFQTTNPWNQTYTLYVTQPSAGNLQGLVVTSGGEGHTAAQPAFGNRIIPETAAMAGAIGGYFPTGDIPGQAAGVVQGAYGGWQFALAGTDIPNPGAGRLAALAYFSSGTLANDYLYRVEIPGYPELNTMSTNLHMAGNRINMGGGDVGGAGAEGIGRLNFEGKLHGDFPCASSDDEGTVFFDQDEGLYVCRNGEKEIIADTGNSGLFQSATIASNGDLIPKPLCPSGVASNPQIFVTPAIFYDDTHQLLRGVQAWATNVGDDWQVHIQVLTPAGWMTPVGDGGKVQVITRCAH